MPQYEFTLLVHGDVSAFAPDARCRTDATIPGTTGPSWLHIAREAPRLVDAVITALEEVTASGAEVAGLAPVPSSPLDSATIRQILAADHQVRSSRLLRSESEREQISGLHEYLLNS